MIPVQYCADNAEAGEELRAAMVEALTAAVFDPALHPRHPGGDERGGEWAPKSWVGPELDPDKGYVDKVALQWRPNEWENATTFQHGNPHLAVAAERHGMTVPEYEAAVMERVREDLDNSVIASRVPIKVFDDIVLEDGRMKSQFETNTSRGTLDNGVRAAAEGRMFGYPEGLPKTQRPIYGYVQKPGQENMMVHQYGEVEIEWRNNVKSRTTFTASDSLAQRLLPSPIRDPSVLSVEYPQTSYDPLTGSGQSYSWSAGSYVEAQIHEGVSIDDIAAVTFPGVYRESIEGPTPDPGDYAEGFDIEEYMRLRQAVEILKADGVAVEYRG